MNLAQPELTDTTGYSFHQNGHRLAFKLRWRAFKWMFYALFSK